MVMDPPGGRDERRRQAERLRREEAYYHFINDLSEEEYRLMRDSNLLGTPGEVTAEELRQRLDGAKERVSSQPRPEPHPQNTEAGEEEGSSGTAETGAETSNGDSLLEWLNTFRRTGNATRSGQSGNQTWRAVSRTNPNSGEFRFSLEININHEQPEPGEHSDTPDPSELAPVPPPSTASIHTSPSTRPSPYTPARPSPYTPTRPSPYPSPRATLGRRAQTRRTRSTTTTPPLTPAPFTSPLTPPTALRSTTALHLPPAPFPITPPTLQDQSSPLQLQSPSGASSPGERQEEGVPTLDCPRVPTQSGPQGASVGHEPRRSRTRSRGRIRRAAAGGGTSSRSSRRRSRSPLQRNPAPNSATLSPSGGSGNSGSIDGHTAEPGNGTASVSMETGEALSEPAVVAEAGPEAGEQEGEAHTAGAGGAGGVRRHPTIMLDLQVRRIRPGENRDRDSIASRTRSRARAAENTVTFESDSGGFRRTISRSERAGIRTYVSTIRIPLRRISETGLGEPSSTALRSILRQIMTGFGELSSLMETEADSESTGGTPGHQDPAGPNANANTNTTQAYHSHGNESGTGAEGQAGGAEMEREGAAGAEEEGRGQERLAGSDGGAGGVPTPNEGRPTSRDTNNLVENGTLPILRLAHFFLLNDEEDEEHPRGLTKEQIDNLATRTYGQASLEGEAGRACSVCINEYAQGNKLRRLPCAHEFHIHCIDRWLSENNTCPICRQPILPVHQD
ncbi:E3 ubiquitin-protein ligase RNF12-A-like [Coregonus clupeaformis]|uniref:E3 ubiquitin-protein ligase RNF12-A-like n=1 Tax=Coregonus clupeaformis TaxID=59861 RepID=UPI001E1C4279|nr:E3 ubiquitin-protein ligase RNF12-A-like [Coregonus clupeaformis]XP_045077180.1 E3 ubiquitin-protein ligase RNF12-A-like [Coregonus clupeaformis]XP_045077181.1 E3 ubiquitin-protein ligase RNF12-A-like [Coregonus clupeaformis]